MDAEVSLSPRVELGMGIFIGGYAGLWILGVLLFLIMFFVNRGRVGVAACPSRCRLCACVCAHGCAWPERFLRGPPWLWKLTHVVAWVWAFHLGLTVSLLWIWHRFKGLDPGQRTQWTDRLCWTLLALMPIVPCAMVIAISLGLLVEERGLCQLRAQAKRGSSKTQVCKELEREEWHTEPSPELSISVL
ncbi:uncharacterized protein LOC143686180 isoform X2 [Tamandua tetradactyla]|uniref:uncharacterized protein LOC143686180 isoform X2 n=1 Tax=Tamandua tetradactyla TaxID=48850 RepID=UPI0040545505